MVPTASSWPLRAATWRTELPAFAIAGWSLATKTGMKKNKKWIGSTAYFHFKIICIDHFHSKLDQQMILNENKQLSTLQQRVLMLANLTYWQQHCFYMGFSAAGHGPSNVQHKFPNIAWVSQWDSCMLGQDWSSPRLSKISMEFETFSYQQIQTHSQHTWNETIQD